MHKICWKVILKGNNFAKSYKFLFQNSKLCFKIKSYFDHIWEKDGFKPPLFLASVAPCNNPDYVEILRKNIKPPKLKLLIMKFGTNPMMDIKRTTILIKNLKVYSWKSFHKLHYDFCLHTICFHEQHFFTHNIQFSFHTLIFLLSKKNKIK